MYKDDDPIRLSLDDIDDDQEYEFDDNRLQYKKGHKPTVASRPSTNKNKEKKKKKNKKKRGGGDCSDWLCKKSIRYRFGYAVTLAVVLALVFTTPRTTLWLPPKYETYNTASVVAFGTVLFVMLLSYWIVQNSDPGYLTDIVNPDDAVLYSTDAFRAHLYKSEWGDEDDGTWEESTKHIMIARTKFTDEDLENAEREAEAKEQQRLKRRGGGGSNSGGSGSGSGSSAKNSSTGTPTDIEAVDTFPTDSSGNTKRKAHGDDSEIEGLLFHESAVGGTVTTYRIDTKHPDLPYRAIYCKAERRWIAMFDHYCGVLGTPIGEKNHARFWWYLCIQTMSLCYAVGIVHSGFRNSIYKEWYSDNAYHLWVALVLYVLVLFVGSLWIFHTWLAFTNMTSYEFMRSDKIDYLQGTKDFDLPYSHGCFKNLNIFCCNDGFIHGISGHEWKPTEWGLPKPVVRDGGVEDNLWENRYYRCC